MLTLISVVAILFCGSNVSAEEVVAPPEKLWSIDWSSKYQFSLHSADDAEKNSAIQSGLTIKYVVSPTLTVQGVVGGLQAIRPALDFRVLNPELSGSFNLSRKESTFKFSIGPSLVLPFGSDAKDESLIIGTSVGAKVAFDPQNPDGVGFKASYGISFNKNFHQYETSVYAEVNNQYSFNHSLGLEYDFSPKLNINASLGFSSLWNYLGVISNNYSVAQELDYQVMEMLTLFIAHERGGDYLSPNGQNYSFGIFDPNSSRVSVGLTLSL